RAGQDRRGPQRDGRAGRRLRGGPGDHRRALRLAAAGDRGLSVVSGRAVLRLSGDRGVGGAHAGRRRHGARIGGAAGARPRLSGGTNCQPAPYWQGTTWSGAMEDHMKTYAIWAGLGAAVGVGIALGMGLKVLATGAAIGIGAGLALGV